MITKTQKHPPGRRAFRAGGRNTESQGFTLVEIIVVLGIGAMLTIILGELVIGSYQKYAITTEQTTQVSLARRLQDTIVKELREAIVSDRGDYPLIKAEANRLEFYSDVDRDAARERIRYWRENSVFKRGFTEPSGDPPQYKDADEIIKTIGEHLIGVAPVFRYYKKDGTELTPPLDMTAVTLLGINFTIDVAPGRLPNSTDVKTTVQLRNIKANLEE